MRRALLEGIRPRLLLWFGIAIGFIAGYHALLLGMMVVRFGHWPNFAKFYDVVDAFRLIIAGTPSWSDALPILLAEPLLDVGYLSPQWRIAEWSLMILPQQLAQVMLLGFLLATFAVLLVAARRRRCPSAPRSWKLAAALGAGLSGMASATLFWVICCATPTWVVALAMLGFSVTLASALEPAGHLLTASGFGLLVGAIVAQLRHMAMASAVPNAAGKTGGDASGAAIRGRPRMNVRLFAVALFALVPLLGGCMQDSSVTPPEPRATDGVRDVAPFSLIDHRGRQFERAQLLGHWTFVTFGFTSCPDVCPTMLVNLAEMKHTLDGDWKGPEPQFVFVSVDPKRDTVELLAKYVPAFDPHFLGVTGTQDAVDRMHGDFGGVHRIGKPDPRRGGYYTVDHTLLLYVVDPEGRLHAQITPPFDPAGVARRIARIAQARAEDKPVTPIPASGKS